MASARSLFLFRKELHDGLTDCPQHLRVDVLHGVVRGVPVRSEGIVAIGIIRNDVDGGNHGNFVHRHMVVGDVSAGLLREVGLGISIARCLLGSDDDDLGIFQ